MSWGVELWDQWDALGCYTQKGITFLENYGHFIKERCQIEFEYAKNLRRLVKNYLPKKRDEDEQFTFVKAFRDAVQETGDLAGQHEVIAETLAAKVLCEINVLVKDLKEERKKSLKEGSEVQQALTQQLQQLEKSKKNYEKAFKEAEKAKDQYKKADADLNLSRADVEKQRNMASFRSRQCEEGKTDYANQLQRSNDMQGDHYGNRMPSIFQGMQDIDAKRINEFKSLLKISVEIERSVFPIINKCLDGIVTAADSIDSCKDSQLVIEKYKSGFTPPGDIPFDDLSTPRQNGECTPVSHPASRHDTMKGTMSASRLRKRAGLFNIFGSNKTNLSFTEKDDFSDLPPNQRRKKIQQKIDEITNKMNQETAARDALLKMKDVYEGNPSLGDPMTITGQLNDSYHTIEKHKLELERYQAMLEESETDGANSLGHQGSKTTLSASPHPNGGSSPRLSVASHRSSLSDESLSGSASESSVFVNHPHVNSFNSPAVSFTQPQSTNTATISCSNLTKGQPAQTNITPAKGSSSYSPESGIGLSHNSIPSSDICDQAEAEGADDSGEFYDIEPLPIIGTCKALYPFEGTSEGSMPMTEGEQLSVIELDQGDGWTRVRRINAMEEGFVPTTYIELTISNNF